MKAAIFNIQKFCTHDGPGIRTAVFMAGCPLRCKWCHNPEGQKNDAAILLHKEDCVKIPDAAPRYSCRTGLLTETFVPDAAGALKFVRPVPWRMPCGGKILMK